MNSVPKPKRKKRTDYIIAKDKAWNIFSRYIRLRDCIKTTGTIDYGVCCTCKQKITFKGNHAGHFVDGRRMSILFNEYNVHLQCIQCNKYLQGNKVLYTLFMQKEYGQKVIDELLRLNNITKKYKPFELTELVEIYKIKYQNLLNNA